MFSFLFLGKELVLQLFSLNHLSQLKMALKFPVPFFLCAIMIFTKRRSFKCTQVKTDKRLFKLHIGKGHRLAFKTSSSSYNHRVA
jgi:hypothetical protein